MNAQISKLLTLVVTILMVISFANVPIGPDVSPDQPKVDAAILDFLSQPEDGTSLSIIVQSKLGTSTARQVVTQAGGKVTAELSLIQGVAALANRATLRRLVQDGRLSAVSYDYQAQVNSLIENRASPIGVMERVSLDKYKYYVAPLDIGARELWEQGVTGKGVTVAVVDSGFELTKFLDRDIEDHDQGKRYAKRLLAWVDFVDPGIENLYDPHGHGTHVAGLIASNWGKTKDLIFMGVTPQAHLVSVRVLGEDGSGPYSRIIQGLQWVADNAGEYNIRVVNLSMVAEPHSLYVDDVLNQAVEALWARGLVVVAAAGNGGPDGSTITVPGNDPFIITVGAIHSHDTTMQFDDDIVAPFSSIGPTFEDFVKPDIVAPGVRTISLLSSKQATMNEDSDFAISGRLSKMSGTSSSTALTSGAAALLLQARPDLSPEDVKFLLMSTARVGWHDGQPYHPFQQGAGYIWLPDAVRAEVTGNPNQGLEYGVLCIGNASAVNESWAGGQTWAGGVEWVGGQTWAGGVANTAGWFEE